jgi:hypothetical protein
MSRYANAATRMAAPYAASQTDYVLVRVESAVRAAAARYAAD